MLKLVLIGLDGATFRVIKPLCDEGKLPNLERLITKGAHGVLESTFPPVTGPAWTAQATGKNPGKTGVFDSLRRTSEHNFDTKPFSSADIRKAGAYWDYLSNAGVRVGVVNYPFLYPPYEINGVMVSGLGSNPQDEICYPRELKQLLIKKCGDYRILVPVSDPKYTKDPPLFTKHILELLEINHKTLELLLQSDLEALIFVISASDLAQHYMWRYIDPSQPYYQKEEAAKYRQAFVKIWQRIDDILGSTLKAIPQSANVLIASDHGFGPHQSSFYTNSWLEEQGYAYRKNTIARARKLQGAGANLVRRISPRLYYKLIKLANSGKIPKIPAASEVDMERSLAFSPVNASLTGQIYINRPIISRYNNIQSVDAIRGEIVEKLEKTCHDLGLCLKVYSPADLYRGQYLNLIPDILFEIDDFECSIFFGFRQSSFQRPPANAIHSGIHKKEGIFIAYGSDISRGATVEGAKIYDIAPTILHMFGLPVPADMDGRVLTEIFREDSEPAQRKVRYQEVDVERERLRSRIKKLKEFGKL